MTDLPYTYTEPNGDSLRMFSDGPDLVVTVRQDGGARTVVVPREETPNLARAVLAAAGDTGCRVVSQSEVEALQHRPEDRCYFCATDAEMTAAMESRPHPTIHMNLPEGACPQVRTTEDPGEPQDETPRDTELIQQVRALVKRYGAPWVAYEAARQARH